MDATSPESPPTSGEPNFDLPQHDAIRGDNWPEYAARGFWVLYNQVDPSTARGRQRISLAQSEYGVANVYTGSPYEPAEQRPLDNMPGVGIYVGPDGMEYATARHAEFMAAVHPPDTPASSR